MITIDIETRSDKDITKCGVYAYTDTPYFDILLFAYSIDGQLVQVVDTANGEEIPENVLAALADENVIKRAFNVNFERVCLSKYLRKNYPQYFQSYSIDVDTIRDFLNPESWHCSMVHARTLGLPSSLAEVGKVLGIEQQKMIAGKALVKFFCVPYDTVDGVPQFHSPEDYPEKWEFFKVYNKRDVEAEMEIDKKLSRFPVSDFIWREFYLDQEINDRGILVDMQLADKAINLDAEAKEELMTEMQRLTGVENPNSVYQLLGWLETQGYKSNSLSKTQVQELIKTAKEPVKSVLQMRLQLSKSSVKKYTAMKNTACSDNRARGMFSFYGASRTGRWAGRNLLYGEEDRVGGDSGYLGADKRKDAVKKNKAGKKIKYNINRRPSSLKKLSRSGQYYAKKKEHEKSSVRCKVEHVFAIVKRLFRYRKTRYRGLRKQTAKLNIMFALANLYLADRKSLTA